MTDTGTDESRDDSCRDARSVRPSPSKVTVSSCQNDRLHISLFDDGRTDRASLQGDVGMTDTGTDESRDDFCRDARSVRPSPSKVTVSSCQNDRLHVSLFDNGRPPARHFRASLQIVTRPVRPHSGFHSRCGRWRKKNRSLPTRWWIGSDIGLARSNWRACRGKLTS